MLSKVFTSILNERLIQWSNDYSIVGEEQAGFRKGFSTSDNVFVLDSLVRKYLRKLNGRFYAVFVDFEKAFDQVNRDLLFEKLQMYEISCKMQNILKAIYMKMWKAVFMMAIRVNSLVQRVWNKVVQFCL